MPEVSASPRPRAGGGGVDAAGQALTAVYAVFALAAVGRSTVQLATRAAEAPVAYTLSACAAVIYVAGLVALRAADRNGDGDGNGDGDAEGKGHGRVARRWALRLCAVELAGVVGVGAYSLIAPRHFPEASVWSEFGSGYGYLPLALPLCAALWLRLRRRGAPTT
ncbi:hypothetical protein [Streptomyces cavernicola]|uniref:Integral membrane protein n=1 Tax=Streptomyces cavernicola TaxID=3043613 RepID=A0ABT6SJV2_9ACTN|nr:hypothetical protein [Streptomyces sp. B-S-A6]MDI3408169.1 hypothetical protein [Streptomyces sp. B-S-A6]